MYQLECVVWIPLALMSLPHELFINSSKLLGRIFILVIDHGFYWALVLSTLVGGLSSLQLVPIIQSTGLPIHSVGFYKKLRCSFTLLDSVSIADSCSSSAFAVDVIHRAPYSFHRIVQSDHQPLGLLQAFILSPVRLLL